jgi:hypothetical protein
LLDTHAAELVRLNVDVIVALQTPAVLAAHRATRRVPMELHAAMAHDRHRLPDGDRP